METRPRRRQARGERRMEQILDAAGRVFARVGFTAATTNAIAAEAGISPGSLYQFFRNKDAIAEALEARYAEHIRAAHSAAREDLAGLPVEEAVERLVAPVVAYGLATPGFQALFAERRMPDDLAASAHQLHRAMVSRVDAMIGGLGPAMPRATRTRRTLVAVQVCRALMPMIVAADDTERPALVQELKTALARYLSAGEPATAREPARTSPRGG